MNSDESQDTEYSLQTVQETLEEMFEMIGEFEEHTEHNVPDDANPQLTKRYIELVEVNSEEPLSNIAEAIEAANSHAEQRAEREDVEVDEAKEEFMEVSWELSRVLETGETPNLMVGVEVEDTEEVDEGRLEEFDSYYSLIVGPNWEEENDEGLEREDLPAHIEDKIEEVQ